MPPTNNVLPELLEATGHDPAAVEVARIASQRGLADSSTIALLEAVDAGAAGVARTLLGADAKAAVEDTPPEPERSASEMFSTELRRAAGHGTPRDAEAAVAQTGAQGTADAVTFEPRSPSEQISHAVRVAAGVVAPDADPAA